MFNRNHSTRSLYYCLFAPHAYIFVLRAHPVCGESHNQRNATREVATPVRSTNANNMWNRFCLQRLVSVIKFIAEWGRAFRDMKTLYGPETLSKKFSKHFSSKISKKDEMLLVTDFATVSQIANHCQISCCIIKFCYSWVSICNVTILKLCYT